jgi:hypothetical protein
MELPPPPQGFGDLSDIEDLSEDEDEDLQEFVSLLSTTTSGIGRAIQGALGSMQSDQRRPPDSSEDSED